MSGNREMATSRADRIVRRRAAQLASDVSGDVLHLGSCPSRRLGRPASVQRLVVPAELGSVGPVDTVLSVCELWRPAWGADELAALACRLRAGGRLLFVEPVAVTGASGLAQRLLDRSTPSARGRLRFDRHLLDELRAVGLTPISVDRFCPDPVGRVRSFVVGAAMRR